MRTPFELRKRRRGSMLRKAERRGLVLEMRAKPDGTGGTMFVFEGYGSVFDSPFEMWDPWGDPYTEVVRPGAFTRTLARPDLDVPFLIGHNDQGIPLARTRNGTMQLAQDSRGLHVRATMDGRRSDVQNLASAVERGDMDEMSIGFVTMGQEWSPDYEQRSMLDIEMHRGDVSSVALGACSATAGASMVPFPVEAISQRRPAEQRLPTQPYSRGGDETVTCPQCQSGNERDARYCDQCGTGLKPVQPYMAGPEETQECRCGAWNAPDAKVCDQCGQSLVNDHDADDGYPDWYASRRPAERRSDAAGTVMDTSSAPDYNPGAHGDSSLPCPNPGCPVPGGAMNARDAKFCDQCGGPLYNEDGLIVLDDSGVVEEVGGSMADADLLSRRLRLLELA
jgi:hypothetical protein